MKKNLVWLYDTKEVLAGFPQYVRDDIGFPKADIDLINRRLKVLQQHLQEKTP